MANLLELPLELFESLINLLLSLDRLDDALRLTHVSGSRENQRMVLRPLFFTALLTRLHAGRTIPLDVQSAATHRMRGPSQLFPSPRTPLPAHR